VHCPPQELEGSLRESADERARLVGKMERMAADGKMTEEKVRERDGTGD
jgi:hypothetical protein